MPLLLPVAYSCCYPGVHDHDGHLSHCSPWTHGWKNHLPSCISRYIPLLSGIHNVITVCVCSHTSNLRSSKFTRLLLDSDVVCDVACCQIFIFNVYSLMINDYKTNEKNEATDSAEWIYSDNHYNWRHGQRISLRQCKYTNNSLIPKSIVHWYIMGQHACALWWHSVSLAVVLTHAS